MFTAFYELYRLLCERVGKSDNAVAAEIGLSNATVTTWRKGATPRRPTLAKVAHYFDVPVGYLEGTTTQAQIDLIGQKLRHLSAVWDFSEECERPEVEKQIEELERQRKELYKTMDLEKEKAPAPEGRRSPDPDIRRIERARANMSEKDKKKMMELLRLSFEDYFSDDYEDDDVDE